MGTDQRVFTADSGWNEALLFRWVLEKGTTVTVKEVKKDETGATWVRIPSGWICAITSKGDIYLS